MDRHFRRSFFLPKNINYLEEIGEIRILKTAAIVVAIFLANCRVHNKPPNFLAWYCNASKLAQ